MALHEADLEYGPTPEDATREHTDIEPSIAWKFAIWLSVAMVLSLAIVYGTFWFFESREESVNRAAQVFPLAAGQKREPPRPQLQTQPFKDIYTLRGTETEKLSEYGWVDKNTGVVHIPIEDAMRLAIEKGILPSAGGQQPAQFNQSVPADSAAGRISVTR